MIARLLKFWGLYGIAVVALVAIVYLGVTNYRLRAAQEAANKAKDEAFAAQAAQLGWEKGKRVSAEAIAESLNREALDLGQELARLQAKDKSVVPVFAGKATVKVSDSVPGTSEGSVSAPSYCPEGLVDEYGRFHVSVPRNEAERPIFKRDQLFSFDVVAIKRLTGNYELGKAELREYRPGSEPSAETQIPLTGVDSSFHFQILEEVAPAVKPFHLRAVFLLDHRLAVGGGIELFNFKDKGNLSVGGMYDRKTGKADGLVILGYRIGKTNISVGPYWSPTGRSFGAAATLELTR